MSCARLKATTDHFVCISESAALPVHCEAFLLRWSEISRRCFLQAAARQAKFESSAGGKAAKKAMDNVKKERDADAAARNDTAKEWLS